MGKRSDFTRRPQDRYDTPLAAVLPLIPHLPGHVFKYYEPCAGKGALLDALSKLVPRARACGASDIRPRSKRRFECRVIMKLDAFDLDGRDFLDATVIITNPPWDSEILLELIDHLRQFRPTWLLLSADFAHNVESGPYMDYCRAIVPIGRVKWMPDSPYSGKDNCAWYRFEARRCRTRFYKRIGRHELERRYLTT